MATMNNPDITTDNLHATRTVFIIAGPTAVGKTAVAIELAKRLDTSIISADSRQCYKGMSIGTAQPTSEELASVTHYFIDEFPVTENISAADYEQLALGYLDKIFKVSNYAVVCGGTGLYIKALTEGLDEMPAIDELVEQQVNEAYRVNGLQWLQDTLRREDPLFFNQAEQQNPARLIRALVFKRSTGQSISQYRSGAVKQRPFNIVKYVLELPRELLYERINRRVDHMIAEGLVEEVRSLLPFRHLKNLQTVGYSEIFDHLDGKCSLKEAIEKIKQHTRNYAKRQLTWFRKDKTYMWLDAGTPDVVTQLLSGKK